MKVLTGHEGVPIKAWTGGVHMDTGSVEQLENIAGMPFIHKHVAVMPDVHLGKGATIGSVIPTSGAIIPAAVGVDIGCGMVALPLAITASQLPDNLSGVRSAIEEAVPHGRTNNGGPGDKGAWPADKRQASWKANFDFDYDMITEKHPKAKALNTYNHLGTLGTGNHFVEICLDETDRVWIMLHSGSRGLGNRFGMYFIEKAKEEMRRWFINLPDQDLAYIVDGSELFADYMEAVDFAQRFASENRMIMLWNTLFALRDVGLPVGSLDGDLVVNCHHNYVAKEHHFNRNVWVTRKGAVRAREGDLGIIPGSMGAKSFIVRGKGNAQSFNSCSHGAGRVMSRTQARKMISHSQHCRDTEGVECRKDEGVIDESPAAYKDIDAVMAAQSDLVEIVHTLKQVVCVKG